MDATRALDYLRTRGLTGGCSPAGYRRRLRILEEFTAAVGRERDRALAVDAAGPGAQKQICRSCRGETSTTTVWL